MSESPGRRSRERLPDILSAVTRTKHAESMLVTAEDAHDEVNARIAFDAILYNLVVIGEAVKVLLPALIASQPDIPWRDVVDMRNFLAHEYFRVSATVVRRTIDEPLDQLRKACEQFLTDPR